MRPFASAAILAVLLAMGAVPGIGLAQESERSEQVHWPAAPAKKWPRNDSMPRHHVAMAWGVPAPYAPMSDPLEQTGATIRRGAKVYVANCVSCHGPSGQGDGKAGRNLSPPPGNLVWLSQMPTARLDAFMYWTVAEGGTAFATAMPAFKETLPTDDIWAVIAYVEARLPKKPKNR